MSALKADDLASAARVVDPSSGDSTQQLLQNTSVPKTVKDALQAMQSASATVLGTDGHRRQCRYEGVAYMETFGPPHLKVCLGQLNPSALPRRQRERYRSQASKPENAGVMRACELLVSEYQLAEGLASAASTTLLPSVD